MNFYQFRRTAGHPVYYLVLKIIEVTVKGYNYGSQTVGLSRESLIVPLQVLLFKVIYLIYRNIFIQLYIIYIKYYIHS